jgi:hypothetical protein
MTMSRRIHVAGALLLACTLLLALAVNPLPARAAGEGLEDDGGAQWRLEPITPPPLPDGQRSTTPIGLGSIGDIEFWAPNRGNRGLLITAGNGNTIPPGLWAYNGQGWHELATVCGASDGRIAWAGPEEFWTISDGRPGQAANAQGDPAPIEDDTLCHFAGGAVVGSYASPAFQSTSYQPMHAAGCIGSTDCWFAGNRVPEPLLGSFHLHWNGSSLEAKSYEGEAQPVEDMLPFEDRLYESVRVLNPERTLEEPPAVHLINPEGFNPTFESISNIPLYGPGEFPEALDFLHLSADSEALWGAAGPVPENEAPEGSAPAKVTVVRDAGGAWSQLLGPESPGGEPFAGDIVTSIAAEPQASGAPGGDGAWVALDTPVDFEKPSPTARALVARVSAGGIVSDEQTLPSASEEEAGVGPKGAAKEIACPAPHDCWLATTQGWLFHLSTESERRLPEDPDPAFANLITYRPPDEGLPQVLPDAPPADDSGLLGEPPTLSVPLPQPPTSSLESTTTVALLSHIRTRLVHGSTLELRFHLAVKARLRLLAKRRGHLVASTSMRTLAAGNRQLLLRLDPRRWPTKLALQSHALAPLPKVATSGPGGDNSNTVSTGLVVLPRTLLPAGSELLR